MQTINKPAGLQRYELIQDLCKQSLDGLGMALELAKIKENALVYVFASHPHKVEFEAKKEQILRALRTLYRKNRKNYEQNEIVFSRIVCEVSFRPKKSEQRNDTSVPRRERAKGNFTINAKCPHEVRKSLENIRQIIKQRQKNAKF